MDAFTSRIFLQLFDLLYPIKGVLSVSLCVRIRQVDPFNTTWVPHTPGMQPFPAQGQQLDLKMMENCCLPQAEQYNQFVSLFHLP